MIAIHQAEQEVLVRREAEVRTRRRALDDEVCLSTSAHKFGGYDPVAQPRAFESGIDASRQLLPDTKRLQNLDALRRDSAAASLVSRKVVAVHEHDVLNS